MRMTEFRWGSALRRSRLSIEVLTWRWGWLFFVAIFAVVAAFSLCVGLELRSQGILQTHRANLALLDQDIQRMRAQRDSVEQQRDPIEELRSALKASGVTEDAGELTAISMLTRLMRERGWSWRSTDYRETRDAGSGLLRVQVRLDVSAPYPQIRAFIEQILRDIPQASVDAVEVKRDGAEQPNPTAVISVSLWSWPQAEKGAVP